MIPLNLLNLRLRLEAAEGVVPDGAVFARQTTNPTMGGVHHSLDPGVLRDRETGITWYWTDDRGWVPNVAR